MNCRVTKPMFQPQRPKYGIALTLWVTFYGLLLANTVRAEPASLPRVASINLCTDQLLLAIAEPEQIVSISMLGQDHQLSYYVDKAKHYPINDGLAEQLLPLQPDVIVGSQYTARETLAILRQLGFQVELFGLTAGFPDIFNNITKMGELLGQQQRAARLIVQMQKRLQAIASQSGLQAKQPRALIYAPKGFTSGKTTLSHQVLEHAGLRNLASELGIQNYGYVALEQVITQQPDWLIINDSTENKQSLAQRFLAHPVLQHWREQQQMIKMPSKLWICGGPMAVEAVELLYQFRITHDNN